MNNLQWYQDNLEMLRQEYMHKWVAIHDERIVLSANSFSQLLAEIQDLSFAPLVVQISEERDYDFTFYGHAQDTLG